MHFNTYPFEKLSNLLKDVKPKHFSLNLSIGEPSFGASSKVLDELRDNANLIRFYPKSKAEDYLIDAQINFNKTRFNIDLSKEEIIPTFGSREVLFNFPQFLLSSFKVKAKIPLIAYPNPFYQIYEGAAIASRANIAYMPLTSENNFTPSLSAEILKKLDLLILNSPNNPTGRTLSLEELQEWIRLARKYDFTILNDECYSEIYSSTKPSGILQASIKEDNKDFTKVFALNSISKISSAPGLRSGFIAGDKEILKKYRIYRSYLGVSIPLPLQKAAALAWGDVEYAKQIRAKFAQNIALAKEIFENQLIYDDTFYVWLKVQNCNDIHLNSSTLFNDELFTKELYANHGITCLPGSYLGREGIGSGFVRMALTHNKDTLKPALKQVRSYLDYFLKQYPCKK